MLFMSNFGNIFYSLFRCGVVGSGLIGSATEYLGNCLVRTLIIPPNRVLWDKLGVTSIIPPLAFCT